MDQTRDTRRPLLRRQSAHPPRFLERALEGSGVQFNGPHAWDIHVHSPAAYSRMLAQGALGFGEGYVDGLWDCQALDECTARLVRAGVNRRTHWLARLRFAGHALHYLLGNPQSLRRAFAVTEHHYDIGNDLFDAMLDPSMLYSCGYWARARTLDQSQRDKLDLICRKLDLQPGEHLLDIGCGWGGLAEHAARHHGVRVTGITISREQATLARERCRGLPVEITLLDYRQLEGRFDKVVSVGMFEHVGPANYATFFDQVQAVLAGHGLFLLHSIGNRGTGRKPDPWFDKYIFPNGKLPSASQIAEQAQSRFIIEDWHNFGPDYDRTLLAWWHNFDVAWPRLKARYGERFYRQWRYYLHASAGFFRSREGQLWQVVMSRPGGRDSYRSVR